MVQFSEIFQNFYGHARTVGIKYRKFLQNGNPTIDEPRSFQNVSFLSLLFTFIKHSESHHFIHIDRATNSFEKLNFFILSSLRPPKSTGELLLDGNVTVFRGLNI